MGRLVHLAFEHFRAPEEAPGFVYIFGGGGRAGREGARVCVLCFFFVFVLLLLGNCFWFCVRIGFVCLLLFESVCIFVGVCVFCCSCKGVGFVVSTFF